jgi:hypothetical protein
MPSVARLKRLAKLESRLTKPFVPFDFAGAAELLRWILEQHAIVARGKACLIPIYGPHREPSLAMVAVMKELDRVAKRLAEERRGLA